MILVLIYSLGLSEIISEAPLGLTHYDCSYPRGLGTGMGCVNYQFVYFSYVFETMEMATGWSVDLVDSLGARCGPDLHLSPSPYIPHSN